MRLLVNMITTLACTSHNQSRTFHVAKSNLRFLTQNLIRGTFDPIDPVAVSLFKKKRKISVVEINSETPSTTTFFFS